MLVVILSQDRLDSGRGIGTVGNHGVDVDHVVHAGDMRGGVNPNVRAAVWVDGCFVAVGGGGVGWWWHVENISSRITAWPDGGSKLVLLALVLIKAPGGSVHAFVMPAW